MHVPPPVLIVGHSLCVCVCCYCPGPFICVTLQSPDSTVIIGAVVGGVGVVVIIVVVVVVLVVCYCCCYQKKYTEKYQQLSLIHI